jgi:uncharacterized protein YndB with AHSA1/START domain
VQAQHTIVIAQPISDVFSVLADFCNQPRWLSSVEAVVQLTPGPIEVGTQFQETHRVLFRRANTVLFEITAYEPPTKLSFTTQSGPVHLKSTYHLEPIPTGTQVTLKGEAQLSWILRVLTPWLKKAAEHEVEKELHALERFLE